MKLDVLIRVAGSVRSPVEQIEALLQEIGPDVTVLVTEPFAAGEYTQLSEADSLEEILEGPRAERVLIYGDEHLLPHVKKLELETVWMAVGPGANPLRNVWRLRGAHPWLGSARLALLLEDETAGKGLANSPTLTTGRISRIVTMPSTPLATAEPEAAVLELVAASAMPPEVEEAPAPEAEPAPEAHDGEEEVLLGETQPVEGAEEPMYTTTGIVSEGARDTQQALLTRYELVKERRTLVPRIADVETTLEELLKEVFATRFNVSPETAGAFEELTGKLARVAGEYRELLVRRARVEEDLAALAWLKNELEM